MRKPAITLVSLVALANLSVWALANRPASEVSWSGMIQGVSFSPYQRDQDPLKRRYTTPDDIDRDLAFLADKVNSVRTYSSRDGIEHVPRLAQRYGLQVTAGAWLDKRAERNRSEIANLIDNALRYDNIERVIVGNESILRRDLTVKELIRYLRQVRFSIERPVSTAEPWHVWLKYPELAEEVDYIAVHLLPYWEEVPIDQAVSYVLERYQQLRQAFPSKPILIAEVGWPSNGNRLHDAHPSLTNEARFIRQFLNIAEARNLDYFLMEAFDQPWKKAIEGSVGAYWGIWDATRNEKFPMFGAIVEDRTWHLQAGAATLLALLPMLWFAVHFRDLRLRGRFFYVVLIQASASLLVWIAFVPTSLYLSTTGLMILGILVPAQLTMLVVVLSNGFELTEMLWSRGYRRHFRPLKAARRDGLPKVSLHLACYNEPPDLVIQTLNSLARLDYPDFEVLVIDNNTVDPAVWKPLQAHCIKLGERFRFFHLEPWPGYKAGALNFARRQTHPDAAVVGVIDSDYVVEPDWLASLMPYFDNPRVGFVQAPQDHRGWEHDAFKAMCNWEYAGFFSIGMVHRNERDAIIQHGTMTLIRREALDTVGEWSEWCLCEDSELGLRLMHAGYESVYVNHAFGRGVTPDSFTAYKGQRFRWAYGAVQILKRHWRWMLPGSRLSPGQRFHFVTGWLPWFADALHLLFTFGALFWSLGLLMLPYYFEFPLAAFLLPPLGMFLFKLLHGLVLYRAHVSCSLRERMGATIAGMALTHTIARAIFAALFTRQRPFQRTPKGQDRPALVRGLMMAREEGLIFVALLLAALSVALNYGLDVREVLLWISLLAVQSLPYGAAVYHSVVNALPHLAPRPARDTAPISSMLQGK